MLLSEMTIKNIQKRLTEKCIFLDDVVVKAVWSARGTTLVRYVFNGDDLVSVLESQEGEFVADLLSGAIATRDYYRFEDIAQGFEKEDSIDLILKVWPIQVEATNVFLIKPESLEPEEEEEEDFTQPNFENEPVNLSPLASKFNIVRRKSK